MDEGRTLVPIMDCGSKWQQVPMRRQALSSGGATWRPGHQRRHKDTRNAVKSFYVAFSPRCHGLCAASAADSTPRAVMETGPCANQSTTGIAPAFAGPRRWLEYRRLRFRHYDAEHCRV